jgi:hypothetical protein
MSAPITLCDRCFRPEATEDQWATVPEGEGEELCWGIGANCEQVDTWAFLLDRLVERTAERDAARADLEHEYRAVLVCKDGAVVRLIWGSRDEAEDDLWLNEGPRSDHWIERRVKAGKPERIG